MTTDFTPVDLPHAGPMRWVHAARLLEHPNESEALAQLSADNPFMVAGHLPRSALIELLAQGAAAGAALRAARQGRRITRGLLVAIKDLHCFADPAAGDLLLLRARQEHALGPLVQGSLEASVGNVLIARGRMTFHLTFE